MTKKAKKRTKTKKPSARKKTIDRVIKQAKDSLTLVETFKEESKARAMDFLGLLMASTKHWNKEAILQQVKDMLPILGLATQMEITELKERVQTLEDKFTKLAKFSEDEE